MKIYLEHNGTVFEFERHPLPGPRFRALLLLALAGLYGGMVVGVARLCGCLGLLILAVATVLSILAANEF